MVPAGTRDGVSDSPIAAATTTANAAASTRPAGMRSDSQPPTGRISTASSTKPAVLFAASVWVRR